MRHLKSLFKTSAILLGVVLTLNLIAAGLVKVLKHRTNSN